MKNIIVFNSGSSSVKFSLFKDKKIILEGLVDSIRLPQSKVIWKIYNYKKLIQKGKTTKKNQYKIIIKEFSTKIKIDTYEKAFEIAFEKIFQITPKENIHAIAHRVVHGAELYTKPTLITKKVISDLKKISFLAPLHNPHNIKGIEITSKKLKNVPQVGVFDTAFHSTIPRIAKTYALPKSITKKYNIRKYGFHGISYSYIVSKLKELKKEGIIKNYRKTIICHMGNGISITAVKNGKSVETSMGFTPLDGMPMGTRIGSIDPGVLLFLLDEKYSKEELKKILNKKSGLVALTGITDMRLIHNKAKEGDKTSKFAIDFLAYNAFKIIGSFISVLNGLDTLVFTGGMGEGAYYLRSKIVSHLSYTDAKLDCEDNEDNDLIISSKRSKVKVLRIHTNEDLQIAKETIRLLK